MKNKLFLSAILFSLFLMGSSFALHTDEWGFWGHRRINRMAVFILPTEMISFYKQNIEYVTEHAVDPDKRRYATKFEAVRHYIDIDHWGTYPFDNVPREFDDALMKFSPFYVVNTSGDTLSLEQQVIDGQKKLVLREGSEIYETDYSKSYRPFFRNYIRPQYFEDIWIVECDSLNSLFGLAPGTIDCQEAFIEDRFSEYGISPYFLPIIQNQLTEAFRNKNISRILRLSAEIGHYIGDAHVPLHTTENYNGQLTNQVGIHAFWESRIPELFADKEYDYFVGKATYIDDPKAYYWEVVLESHQLVDSVLAIEKSLSELFPPDKQYCYEERLGRTIRTQCKEYAAAYQERMGGMVEERMRNAIQSIGSAWYTAWIDAGQPNLRPLGGYDLSPAERKALEELNAEVERGKWLGRKHE
jgi:hypothetical protein